MDQRHLIFFVGVLLLMLLCGYTRDLGRRAGYSAQTVAMLEPLALFA
jgi:hypothetical protein